MVIPPLPQCMQALPPRTSGFVPATKVTKTQLCKVRICQQSTMAAAPPLGVGQQLQVFIFLARLPGTLGIPLDGMGRGGNGAMGQRRDAEAVGNRTPVRGMRTLFLRGGSNPLEKEGVGGLSSTSSTFL